MRGGLGGLETFPGSVLCDRLRPVTAYPGQRVSLSGQGASGEGPRKIGCRLNQKHSNDHLLGHLGCLL